MVLTEKQEMAVKKMPYIQTYVYKSKDGKYLINKTTITTVKPVSYMQTVLDNEPKVIEENVEELVEE
jgi:hypothetical protein